jgi:hypothetical protein
MIEESMVPSVQDHEKAFICLMMEMLDRNEEHKKRAANMRMKKV